MGRDRERTPRASGAARSNPGPIGRLRATADVPRDVGLNLSDYPRILGALTRVIAAGDAVIIGSTSDGGAICFTVLSNGDREKLYAANEEELGRVSEAILAAYGGEE